MELGTDWTKERQFNFVNRVPNRFTRCNKRSGWRRFLDDSSIDGISNISWFEKRQCFNHCNLSILWFNQQVILKAGQSARRQKLLSMIGSGDEFYFDGRSVSSQFLRKTFRSSNDMKQSKQLSRKNLMTTRATDHWFILPPSEGHPDVMPITKGLCNNFVSATFGRTVQWCYASQSWATAPVHSKTRYLQVNRKRH